MTESATPAPAYGSTVRCTGYCVKCKEKRDIVGMATYGQNSTWLAKGACPVCGTTVCRILGKNWTPAS